MLNDAPRVSVVLPMYNAEEFISESLASIQGQTLDDLEILVIDDGSQDRSASIVIEAAKFDERIRLISQVNQGVSAARNHGIASATADLIAFQDADDVSLPDRLRREVDFLSLNEEVAVVGTNAVRIGIRGQELGVFDAGPTTLEEFTALRTTDTPIYLVATSVVARKSVLVAAGGFPVALRHGAEDLALWNRIADSSIIQTLPERLVLYRVHQSSLSSSKFSGQMAETALVAENIKRRRSGRREFSPTEFHAVLAGQSFAKRMARKRDWRSKQLYRTAGALLADRKPYGLIVLLGSFLLKPSTVVCRLRVQLLPWLRRGDTRLLTKHDR